MIRFSSLLAVTALTLGSAHGQIATSVQTVGDVIIDTATFLADYNGNGTPDILEDFSGDGKADALGFKNPDGRLVLFTDFSGDGLPDGFTDFNGSGVPDAFEDFSGSGVPDAFESGFADTNGSGIPDFFERIYPSLIGSTSHPDPRYGYPRSSFSAYWSADDFPEMANGWMWIISQSQDTVITLFTGNYLDGSVTTLTEDDLAVGLHWLHLVPIDSDWEIATAAQVRFAFEVRAPQPQLSSPSHPETDEAYHRAQFIAHWEAPEAESVLQGWLWLVNQSPNTVVTLANGHFEGAEVDQVTVPDNRLGTSWFHLVGVDLQGNVLSSQQVSFPFTVAIDAPVLSPISHGDSAIWYVRDRFTASWQTTAATQVLSGWRWKVVPAGSSPVLTAQNSEWLPAAADYIEVPDIPHGQQVFYLAPVDAAGIIRNELRVSHAFRVIANRLQVTSSSHPDQNQAYALANVQIAWTFPDVDPASIVAYYFDWNREPTHFPTKETSTRVTTTARNFFGQASGSHYFHVVAEDTAGNLTRPAHFRVNIHEITGPEAGLQPLQADFSAHVTTGVAPLTVYFTDNSTGDVVAWAWDFNNDGEVDATVGNPPATIYDTPGTYSVSLTVTGADGGESTKTLTDYITVLEPAPVAAFAVNTVEGYPPLTVTFTDLSSGRIDRREWDFTGDGLTDAVDPLEPIQHTYSEPGQYTVSLTVIGPGGADTQTKAALITVRNYEVPVPAFSADATEGFVPFTVTFTNQSEGVIYSSQWDFNGDGVVDATNPPAPIQYTYTEPGVYTVSLIATGPGGTATHTRHSFIVASERPDNQAPIVEVAQNQIFLTRMGSRAQLDASASSDPDGDPLFYSWRESHANPHQGLIPIGSEHMPVLDLSFPEPGRYEFSLRVSDGQLSSAQTATITVYVPGRTGVVGLSPSDGIVRVDGAHIRVHHTAADAQNGVNPVDAAVTDSMGRFALENISPLDPTTAATYWYRVERSGFQSSEILQMTVRPDPGVNEGRDNLQLVRGYAHLVQGRVFDPDGNPLANALAAITPGLGGQIYASSTDSEGRFELSNVPMGSWTMQLRRSGYRAEVRDVNVSASMDELHFTIVPASGTATLAGQVLLSGTDRPVAGARVLLGNGTEATSLADGRFHFSGVPVGDYVLTASRSGFEPVRLPIVPVREGTNEVTVPMSFAGRGPMVFGTIHDEETGRPIRRATVGIVSGSDLLARSALTDATGYYQLLDVPPGEQIVRVSAPGYHTLEVDTEVEGSGELNLALLRTPAWQPPHIPGGPRPVAIVAQSVIELSNPLSSALLDARPSTGSNLAYTWREHPRNPVLGMLPGGSTALPTIQLSNFAKPGVYFYELQVRSGAVSSANTATVAVYVPGISGNVHISPSDGVFGLNNATVRAYTSFADALAWTTANLLTSTQTSDLPAGDFLLNQLSPGGYWLVARAPAGTGFQPFGPVKRLVNFSTANRQMRVNLQRSEFALSGVVTDQTTGEPLENVRVMVAPGSFSETYRTTTDRQGRYRLAAVPAGSAQPVLLMRDGYHSLVTYVNIAGDTTAHRSLEANVSGEFASLSGYVTARYGDTLLPLYNAEVIIGSGIARAFTDGNGFYRIDHLPPGDYFGTVRKAGYRSTGLDDFGFVSLAPGENALDRVLAFEGQGPIVRAHVVNAHQEPVEGARIRLLPSDDPAFAAWASLAAADDLPEDGAEAVFASHSPGDFLSSHGNGGASTDGGGVFHLTGVPHGPRTVEIEMPDGRVFTRSFEVGGTMEVVWDLPHDALDQWKVRHFGPDFMARPHLSADHADPNADGVPNLLKYFFGQDPMAHQARGDSVSLRREGYGNVLRFERAAGVSDLHPQFEFSTDLSTWSLYSAQPQWIGSSEAGRDIYELSLPSSGGTPVFWRIKVER
jgi:PKD repeat protein